MNPFLHRLTTDVPMLEDGALVCLIQSRPEIGAAEHPGFAALRERLKPKMEVRGDVAVIPVDGALARKPHPIEMAFMGIEDSQNVTDMVNAAAANPEVKGILLNVDSPGGMMMGGLEIADAVRSANAVKPVVAWTGGMAASLAYLIGSQASQVIASRSSQVGSIGTILSIADYSKMLADAGIKIEVFTNREAALKGIGTMGTSLTDPQRAYLQDRVQKAFGEFRQQVVAARPGIPDEAMQGQTYMAADAKKVGLVDRVGDLNFALGVLRAEMRSRATS